MCGLGIMYHAIDVKNYRVRGYREKVRVCGEEHGGNRVRICGLITWAQES